MKSPPPPTSQSSDNKLVTSDEKSKTKRSGKSVASDFPIVGIGASAGGLEALEQFFGNTPKDSGMAFVVIQHLDPNHVGIMPELLQRITPMKVYQATDQLKVKPNCVYVIPPNKSLSILNGGLNLFDPLETRGLRLPIDIFFRSLALDREEKSIGIILSGMGSDGSLGLKAIKEKNGIVLVQDPDSAKFDGMPSSACNAVIVDIVAPAEELPAKLIDFLKYVPVIKPGPEFDDKYQSNLDKIIILLREKTGHDFSKYKKNTLFRRIERRMGVHQIDRINTYVRYLQENPNEIEILFKELLIGVTSFFRDTTVWETLRDVTLPTLFDQMPNGHILRAWVPACSTGEEAYSLAITFKEALEKSKKRKNLALQIFATDIDIEAIEQARKGIYPLNITSDVSPDRINRFFIEEPNGLRLNAAIREMVVFAPQNVIRDPPFTKLDILTCRNMLIYMESELQKKLMALFNYSINDGGIMVLGTAETPGNYKEGFEEIDGRLKIYKRSTRLEPTVLIDFPSSFSRSKSAQADTKIVAKSATNLQSVAEQIMLQQFAPAGVLTNEKGDILYTTGRTGKYLEPPVGKTNVNIHAMAREGLRDVLPGAFRKATLNFEPVTVRNVKIGNNGGTQMVDVTVKRLEGPDQAKGMLMVIFAEVKTLLQEDPLNPKTAKRKSGTRYKELENELQRSYEDMTGIREEMQTSQEELKSTNEELQSTNEELQSTNEELTTSKEEMQSLNEELQTVNVELQSKIGDLVQANNDMKNLLNSTEISTLFLDKELNIRRFTDSTTDIFKLRPADIGRPFTDQTNNLLYPEIVNHCESVLRSLISMETAISSNDGSWFKVRIMPYRTLDDHIDGLVLTFTEVTESKKLEIQLQESNRVLQARDKALNLTEIRYRRLFEAAKDGILILDAESGKIVDVNPFLNEMLGYSKEQLIGKAIWDIGFLKDILANKENFLELQQKEIIRYENLPLETAGGKRINVEFISNVYLVDNQKVIQCFIRQEHE
jgi:two-component system CheB/CheR fusion protein